MSEFHHIPVMLNQCIEGLNIDPDGIYIDGTVGGAGHSSKIAEKLRNGSLIALDQDPIAVKTASERLSIYPQAQVVRSNFANMRDVLDNLNINKVNGILLDLGVSSYQLDEADRGFSYLKDAPLDMRMSGEGTSAKDLVNSLSAEELIRILREYGEEPFAVKIANNIVKYRQTKEIETTLELAEIIKKSIPAAKRRDKNPCKQSFQAIRIAVNGELDRLTEGLNKAFDSLDKGGRLVILTFHSLEDRLVKKQFNEWCKGCICPPDFPVCVCNRKPQAKLVNKKPITADEKEIENNRRSKPAKLRILEKL